MVIYFIFFFCTIYVIFATKLEGNNLAPNHANFISIPNGLFFGNIFAVGELPYG